MSEVVYTDLKLKVDKSVDTFDFNGTKIEVLKYLPVADKYDLLMIVLQKSEENGVYNSLKLDIFFHLYLVYMYTNLSFTDEQKEDEFELYDVLKSSGFMYHFMECMDEDEYGYLFEMMREIVKENIDYRSSAGAVVRSFIQDLPRNAQVAADIIDSFNKEKFKEVIEFAQAANGGRSIENNSNISAFQPAT